MIIELGKVSVETKGIVAGQFSDSPLLLKPQQTSRLIDE